MKRKDEPEEDKTKLGLTRRQFLATMGVAAAWVGLIEGVSDGLSSFAKLASGHWTDRLTRHYGLQVFVLLRSTTRVAPSAARKRVLRSRRYT